MRDMVLRCAALMICASVSLAAQQPSKQAAQDFTVLRSAKLVASVESLTNAEANCAIAGAGSGATMQCRPAARTGKSMYNFNTALVVDSQGMAYVIACRVTLVYFWCKSPAAGQVLQGTVDGANLAIEDGSKIRAYQVLTSQNIGPVPPIQPPAGKKAPAASGPAAKIAASSSSSRKVADNQEKPGSDAAATCMSSAVACVTFASDPQGADIYVDGKFAGNTPSMLALSPGAHEIRVEAARRKPWTRTLEAGAGSKITIRAELEALPAQN